MFTSLITVRTQCDTLSNRIAKWHCLLTKPKDRLKYAREYARPCLETVYGQETENPSVGPLLTVGACVGNHNKRAWHGRECLM